MTQLKRGLTPFGLTMIAVGACIGSGIFLTPAQIAGHLATPNEILLVWLIGGVVALSGALTFAEFGAMFPKSGGVYIYLREAYGDLVAFLYGWVILLVITSGAIAALCIAFAQYLNRIVFVGDTGILWVSIAALLVVTLINIFGVKIGEFFAGTLTVIKLLGIGLIILAAGYFSVKNPGEAAPTIHQPLEYSFGLALIGVLWSYGGWHHASYLSGEARDPQRTVPRAMMWGALIVAGTYILTNWAYLQLLDIGEIAVSDAVAADAMSQLAVSGAFLVALLIALSTFGTAGIYTLSAPRIYYAMARDRLFFSALTKVHPRFQTPVHAILIQSGWALILLLFWQTFENLITYVVFMDFVFMMLAAVSVFVFRRQKRTPGTYKTWGYPVTPAVFIGISMWFVLNTLYFRPIQAWVALSLLALGIPVYYFFKKRNHDA